jgi:hypothetical protein
MSNVLSEEKKQQVIALGKLGWPLRHIEQATGVRRETASAYLKAAGVVVRLPGWGRRVPSKPAIEVTTDSGASSSGSPGPPTHPEPYASACEAYRERVELGLRRGRNANGHLARLGFRSRLCWELSDGEAIRFASFGVHKDRKRRASFSPQQEKKRRSTTAVVRWCATRKVASIAGRGCSC